MGLDGQVVFAAADRPSALAALLQGCLAVVMPSLEPGPALMLFHALEFGKPILCSDVAGWPDAIRHASLPFNPRRPLEIVTVLERMASDNVLAGDLARRSQRQAKSLGGPRDTAGHLLGLFQEVLTSSRRLVNGLKGVYADGWMGERLQLTCAPAAERRRLRLTLGVPNLDAVGLSARPPGEEPAPQRQDLEALNGAKRWSSRCRCREKAAPWKW